MEFFEPLPPESPREQPVAPVTPIWLQPPRDEVGVAVPMPQMLARVPGAALTLQRLDVHRDGIVFTVRLDMRLDDDLSPERAAELQSVLNPREHRFAARTQLRLGVTLPNGTRADALTNSGPPNVWSSEPEPPHLSVFRGTGNGDASRWTATAKAWLWPMPDEGVMILHYLCEAAGITEGSLDIDTAPLIAARSAVIDVWGD